MCCTIPHGKWSPVAGAQVIAPYVIQSTQGLRCQKFSIQIVVTQSTPVAHTKEPVLQTQELGIGDEPRPGIICGTRQEAHSVSH